MKLRRRINNRHDLQSTARGWTTRFARLSLSVKSISYSKVFFSYNKSTYLVLLSRFMSQRTRRSGLGVSVTTRKHTHVRL